jgi:hypothetical protein
VTRQYLKQHKAQQDSEVTQDKRLKGKKQKEKKRRKTKREERRGKK